MRHDDFFVDKLELASVELMIVDLADAQFVDGCGSGRVAADCYRAPEVTLGLPWSYGVDLFAAGCVMAELHLGRGLFPRTQTDLERLAILERVLGNFPLSFAKRGESARPGTFAFGKPVKVRYRPSIEDVEAALNLVRATPLSGLIFDGEYFELCSWLMQHEPQRRRDVHEAFTLSFLLHDDEDLLLVPPSPPL
ncbi:hypothetical protein FKP32DRAFT_1675203 [Trametes sanguinea]|nr:hypothetical protein FKP32DRAFT_1675203 [Trametes sanguinea]